MNHYHPADGWKIHHPLSQLILWLCLLGVIAAIFLFSAQDGLQSSALSDGIAQTAVRLIDPSFDQLQPAAQASVFSFVQKLVRKGAHFAEFAALGFFLRLLMGSYGLPCPTRLAWLAGTLYACTDELHQFFVSDRAAMWQDVALDSCGVLAGIVAAHMVRLLRLRWQKRRKAAK